MKYNCILSYCKIPFLRPSHKPCIGACIFLLLQYVEENLGVMSIGFLLSSPDDAVIWRGPKKNGEFVTGSLKVGTR